MSVTYVAAALLEGSQAALEGAIASVPKHKLFRGGQRPWVGGRAGLASAVMNFDRQHGLAIAEALLGLRHSRSQSSRKRFAYDVVEIITCQNAIAGFAEYRGK